DFYVGYPALTVNDFGSGQAWYVAAHTGEDFLVALYGQMACRAGLPRLLGDKPLPKGLHVASRVKADGTQILFVMNFSHEAQRLCLPAGVDLVTGSGTLAEATDIPALGIRAIEVRG
ncbi:MAG TPA: beta-galactosidase trimerization domain-containing protein, partial [Clostridia bacterium]|nr:beta-galactosidase trimerization domain-containing protein [Clostridia bacterium]